MHSHTTRPRTVARAATIALWGVGSAYLIRHELAAASPDPVVIASTPIVWAVIISLPILATYARHDRQWVAMALIWLAALVGSAYTLHATFGRQASARDTAVATAEQVIIQRQALERDLATTKAHLEAARQRCGTGRECRPATRELVAMYERQVTSHEARLAQLVTPAPAAGEHRIARLISLASGANTATVAEWVSIVAPVLFGLTLELGAFALAMFGWHPCRQPLPPVASGPNGGQRAANVVQFVPKQHPVIEALERAGRPVNNNELASLMRVTAGEATKRRREVAGRIREHRAGKHLMVALA